MFAHCCMTSSVAPEHMNSWCIRKTTVRRTNALHWTMHICTWESVTIISEDHMSMTWLWKSKQLRFMSCPLSAYVVWLHTVEWLLTRLCADRCLALLSEQGTHGGGRTERESDTITPRRQVAGWASAHSLSLSSSWFSAVWFSPGRSGRFRRGWKMTQRPRSSTSETEFVNKPEAGKSWASWGRCERAGDGWACQNFASKPQWRQLNVNKRSYFPLDWCASLSDIQILCSQSSLHTLPSEENLPRPTICHVLFSHCCVHCQL